MFMSYVVLELRVVHTAAPSYTDRRPRGRTPVSNKLVQVMQLSVTCCVCSFQYETLF